MPRRHHAQHLIVDRIDLRHRTAQFGTRLEKDFDNAGPRQRLALDMVDPVNALRIGALGHQHHTPFHFLGRETAVIPCDQHNRNIDGRENIDHHATEREKTRQDDNERGNSRRIGTPQRDVNQPHHRIYSPIAIGQSSGFMTVIRSSGLNTLT